MTRMFHSVRRSSSFIIRMKTAIDKYCASLNTSHCVYTRYKASQFRVKIRKKAQYHRNNSRIDFVNFSKKCISLSNKLFKRTFYRTFPRKNVPQHLNREKTFQDRTEMVSLHKYSNLFSIQQPKF